jgi:hypothetical protein
MPKKKNKKKKSANNRLNQINPASLDEDLIITIITIMAKVRNANYK